MRREAPLDFMWEAKMAAVSFFRDPKFSVFVECTCWMDRLREFLVLATPKTARGSAATFLVGRKTGLTALPSAGVPREAEQTPQDAEQEEGRSGGDVGPMEEEKGSVDGDGDGKQEGELTHNKESHGMSDLSSSESDTKVCVCGVCVRGGGTFLAEVVNHLSLYIYILHRGRQPNPKEEEEERASQTDK